ncbi:stimulated by retinoic acid gene 6 protein-like [Elgaria multicarinata webbii]|uniref:stimulated by retinoic acid gene 6 protein-like n=1 Tax=Elgaria multicarinata webbii TaxID=159646 RepID=UPI002FCCC820
MEDAGEDLGNTTIFNNATCEEKIEVEDFLPHSLVPSAIIIIILACLEKRVRRCCLDEKLPCLSGCFGVMIPFDFVSSFSNRWSLGFAFGVTADKVMYLFINNSIPEGLPAWAKVFWVLLIAMEVGISSYPFFACLSTSYVITGATLGFLYTAAWLMLTVLDILDCPDEEFVGGYSSFILLWPSLVCQLFLLGRFVFIFVKEVRVRCGLEPVNEEASFMEGHQAQYVQHLLRKPPLEPSQKSWIRRNLYESDPYFKFPSRIISTVVLIIVCLYMFVAGIFMIFNTLLKFLRRIILYFEGLGISEEEGTYFSKIEEFCSVTEGVWIFATVVSFLTCFSYVFHVLACYRKHIKSLRSGKKHFLLPESSAVSSTQSVVSVSKYISWQVAYIMWGYLIIQLVQWVIGMIVMYVFILPMKRGEWMELLNKWGTVILSFVIITVIRKLQVLAAARFCLQPKISPDDKQKPLALDNRKAFMNFSYFLFFHSVVVGLLSCLMRLIRSIVLGAWLVGRIDRPVMPMGFESCDKGFSTWVQMLYLDHYHTNPILVCFCHILDSANRKRKWQRATADVAIIQPRGTELGNFKTGESSWCEDALYIPECLPNATSGSRVSGKARIRWLLLYTLLNNPSLQRIRKLKPGFPSDQPWH